MYIWLTSWMLEPLVSLLCVLLVDPFLHYAFIFIVLIFIINPSRLTLAMVSTATTSPLTRLINPRCGQKPGLAGKYAACSLNHASCPFFLR
jgi:hypothetical protein